VAIFYYAMCHNCGPPLTIIMNDENQYFKKKKIMSKNLYSTMCQIVINGWQSMMLTWHHGCNYNGAT
jgi:hypothetical protein